MPRPLPQNSCTTCRQRKIRCDGALPDCENCIKSKKRCLRSREAITRFIIHTTDPELQNSVFQSQQQQSAAGGISLDRNSQDLEVAQGSVSRLPPIALSETAITEIFQHYIDNLAPWYDLNDEQRQFSTIVPLRALGNSVLFKALIAFSACHINKITGKFQHFGPVFHASCVEELLALLNDTSLEVQEDYLAATCLLRSYEILSGDMRRHQEHLLGAYSFATNRPINLAVRGLAQAGTWNYLREEITVALESRRPVRFSDGFNFVPDPIMADDMWANAITFILANAINLYFSEPTEGSESRKSRWGEISAELASWRQRLPPSFRPFSTATKSGNVFPSIWLLQPWHVAGEQYYSLTEIVLALCQASISANSLSNTELDRIRDNILQQALKVCSLAYTNDDISARVNAFGPLAFCGRYLKETSHRDGLLRLLIDMSKPTGWPVAPVIEELQRHWADEDDSLSVVA